MNFSISYIKVTGIDIILKIKTYFKAISKIERKMQIY